MRTVEATKFFLAFFQLKVLAFSLLQFYDAAEIAFTQADGA